MVHRFPLAPMDRLLQVMTLVCLAIPFAFVLAALSAPGPVRIVLWATGAFVLLLYVFIWVWLRPTAFVVSEDGLAIAWPLRQRTIPASAITGARILDREALRRELGRIVRIGAGGLGGGFGLARTARGTLELWVSRTDRMVIVECEGRRSLLITPDDPERFVRELAR